MSKLTSSNDLLSRLFRLVFPVQNRAFFGMRLLKISLRTLHLIGISGLGGAYIFDQPLSTWLIYLQITILSGIGMLLLDVFGNGVWLIQIRGFSIYLKLILIFILSNQTDFKTLLFFLITILSSMISHAPANIRYFSFLHLKKIDVL